MQSEGFVFDRKPVFDWNHVPVGHVATTRRDPKTNATQHLVLTLSPEARAQLGITSETVELPASFVFGMRRDRVTLDRSLSELRRFDLPAATMLKQ